MNISIFGSGKEAIWLGNKIKEKKWGTVLVFVDYDISKQGKELCDSKIISVDEFILSYSGISDMTIICSERQLHINKWICSFKNKVKDLCILRRSFPDYNYECDSIDQAVIRINDIRRSYLPYLEYNVTDSCNLKCKGCTHFANLFEDNSFADIGSFKRDLKQISDNCFIGILRLLGGEPLLNPMLKDFMYSARSLLPDSEIFVVTNGLLLTKLDKETVKAFHDNKIGIHISEYFPTAAMKDEIVSFLSRQGINFSFVIKNITHFQKVINKVDVLSDEKLAYENCNSANCFFFREGRLYICPIEGLIYKFSEYFNLELAKDAEGIDIYQVNDWEHAVNMLTNSPCNMCKHCADKPIEFEWCVNKQPKLSDWII